MKNNAIVVKDVTVNIESDKETDYICISDIALAKDGNSISKDVVKNWLRNRQTLEFLGNWETIYNPNFNGVEFDAFKSDAGLHTFTLSPSEWDVKRLLSKNNYLIHTDAIKNYILPKVDYYKDKSWIKYAE